MAARISCRCHLSAVVAPRTGPAAESSPNLSGAWKLNHQLSDDAAAKVKEAAGSEYIQGGPSWRRRRGFPWGRKFDEDERVLLRDVLLGAVRGLERIEVEQTPPRSRPSSARTAVARLLPDAGGRGHEPRDGREGEAHRALERRRAHPRIGRRQGQGGERS
jgi:hypothetical protein